MHRFNQPEPSLNPYSGVFFGLWFLATVVLSIAFRAPDEPSYKERIDQWHRSRISALRNENGWLNLAGLFWLNEGDNLIGRGPDFQVSLPVASSPKELGVLTLRHGTVRFTPRPGGAVTSEGKPILEPVVVFAADNKSVVLAHGPLRWFIIKRGDKYGVRLRDLESPLLKEFQGIDRYPVDESWQLKARLEPPAELQTISITDVLGHTSPYPLAGTLVFEKGGKTYRLQAAGEGQRLFILFGDPTNAHETYGAGRFLYADRPGADGQTTLDFNQAINPPCAFTPFATCPLPPKQNKLALAITAGEKRYGDH